mmetsp:Transcript_8997/g.13590  ORF Transcript_8997/g.13590 Transcript_8997/m.13590 type:complete len:149 (-) Transcript_8997:130-576(-)
MLAPNNLVPVEGWGSMSQARTSPDEVAQSGGAGRRVEPQQKQLGASSEQKALELMEKVENMLTVSPVSKPKHVVQFFTDVRHKSLGGDQMVGHCMFCRREVHSTGAARMVDHLMGYVLCVKPVKDCVLALYEQRQKRSAKPNIRSRQS